MKQNREFPTGQARKTTVLITGFEPFGVDEINPSFEAVCRLPDNIRGARIIKNCLPVVFGEAAALLRDLIELYTPDIVICVGLAGGRSKITPELTGKNWMDARIPDNKGNQPRGEKIDESGEDELTTTLPVQAMVDRMRTAGLPAEVSHSAGTFVCNETLYRLLLITKDRDIKSGFIHVPFIPGMREGQPAMELTEIIRGLEICIDTCVFHLRQLK